MTGHKCVTQSRTNAWWQRLRTDESGAVDSATYLLMATILGIGAVVGLATIRDQVVQELGDIAVALESLDQSYSFTVGTQTSSYTDPPTTLTDPNGSEPACISVREAASDEGNGP